MPVTVTHAKSNIVADFTGTVTVGNSSGGTATILATDLVRPLDWNSAHQVTFSLAASEIASLFSGRSGISRTTNTAGVSFGIDAIGFLFEPRAALSADTTAFIPLNQTWYMQDEGLPFAIAGGRINVLLSNVSAASGIFGWGSATLATTITGSASQYFTAFNRMAIYTLHSDRTKYTTYWTGANDLFMTHLMTGSCSATSNSYRVGNTYSASWIGSINSAGATGASTFSLAFDTSTASTNMGTTLITATFSNLVQGPMMIPIPVNTTIPAGDYIFGFMCGTSSSAITAATGAAGFTQGSIFNSVVHQVALAEATISRLYRALNATTTQSTTGVLPYVGVYQTSSLDAPASIAASDVRILTTNPTMVWNYVRDAY